MLISYAKGARTWERHVDIEYNSVPVSNYCSLPEQIDEWFKAFYKAQEMSGGSSDARRIIPIEEIKYLDALVRGVHARRDLEAGYVIDSANFSRDFKLAVPLRKGQLSTRELVNGLTLKKSVEANLPITIDDISGPYNENKNLRKQIMERGV
jgi:N-acetylneuraminate synthase